MFNTYKEVLENGEWLEDSGQYSRYATTPEESVWVCFDCETIHHVTIDVNSFYFIHIRILLY